MNRLYFGCAFLVSVFGCGAGTTNDGSDSLAGSTGGVTGSGAGSSSSGSTVGTGGSVGSGSSANAGSGSVDASGAATAYGGTGGGGACSSDTLPLGVQSLLSSKCASCHGAVPLTGLPSLVGYANLTAASKSDPTKTNAAVALARIQSTASPMPPAPGTRATASEIAALQDFVSQNYPKPTCMTGGSAGGASGGAGASSLDPLLAAPTCTSMSSWNNGNRGSASMNPGMACITCHQTRGGEAPTFTIAGTVYPTGHEPDLCNSKVGGDGARVVITGADGKTLTLTPNAAGNFSSTSQVKTPFQAKVTYQGRERLMLTAQTSGDCNSCHTQNGTSMAPGRITVP